jgi:hypothetical protein
VTQAKKSSSGSAAKSWGLDLGLESRAPPGGGLARD